MSGDDIDGVTQWDDIEDDGVLDASDTLDGDAVRDPLDRGIAPADRWSRAIRYGTTPAEQHAGEPLEQRLAEEEPDADPYTDPGDDEDELIRRGHEPEARSGRLVADDPNAADTEPGGEDVESDAVAWNAGIDGGGASAEEAAMHVVDDPDGPGDSPLR
ncbi:DUF5709 domain-containing protein [Virgisporangium aurantiacum]|uniref:DUF5709 domain-containing protein n=1 Tax=Virgisporangium aurantiacum TaxID=175570 RepID=A0A8J3Z121_9ACTN|nr:DUF5709 domain-containing protein [Virgisporangium aurantiacum]GIJ54382.1 hypothetical protein Vau01_018980 [Virgisporangium aurantiacum]